MLFITSQALDFKSETELVKIEKFQSDLFDDLDGPNFLTEDEGQIYNDDEPDYDEVSTLFWTAFYLHFMSWVIPQTKSSVQRKWPWNFTDSYKFNLGNDRFLGFSFWALHKAVFRGYIVPMASLYLDSNNNHHLSRNHWPFYDTILLKKSWKLRYIK